MDKFEFIILNWVCLLDEFKDNAYSSIKHLVSSKSFKQFVDKVFCLKCSSTLSTEDSKEYDTIKVNYHEFEVQKYEDLYSDENSIYTCIVVFLHALLKSTNNQFRKQLVQRMDNEEQQLLKNFLETILSSSFTKQNIFEALMLMSDFKHSRAADTDIFSTNTPIKSNSMQQRYLQEFYETPKSQSLIRQEKDNYTSKLTEAYTNECEENYKLFENIKHLKDLNTKLSNTLEEKNKILQVLKDDIEELYKSKESPKYLKVDDSLIIRKLNKENMNLEKNCNELNHQIIELENKNEELQAKFEMKTSHYNNLISMFGIIENENMLLKTNMKLYEETIQQKNKEIILLKNELCNISITYNSTNINCQEENVMSSKTFFHELSCLKLEEIKNDSEKYGNNYKSIKTNLSNHLNKIETKPSGVQEELNIEKLYLEDKYTENIEQLKDISIFLSANNNFINETNSHKYGLLEKENTLQLCDKELIALSKTQQETIKKLETAMSELKSECNYKMTKVQQNTREYVISEYEKMFKRKQKKMKQYCDGLEAKIHQDYEAKLSSYKDKITNDEIQIKELSQQLWKVNEKYLRLQQNNRRESIISLPLEMSETTTITVPKYNSFSLPNSSLVSQISFRSLDEETSRSYQDFTKTKQNVYARICKKFRCLSEQCKHFIERN